MRFHIATLVALLLASAVAVFCFHDQSVELEHVTARADSLEHRLRIADTLLVEAYSIIMGRDAPHLAPKISTSSDSVTARGHRDPDEGLSD